MWHLRVPAPFWQNTFCLPSTLHVHQTPDPRAPTPQGGSLLPRHQLAALSFSGPLSRELVVCVSQTPILQNSGKTGSKLSCILVLDMISMNRIWKHLNIKVSDMKRMSVEGHCHHSKFHCVCVYVCVYIHTHTHTYTHNTYTHTHMYTHIHTNHTHTLGHLHQFM